MSFIPIFIPRISFQKNSIKRIKRKLSKILKELCPYVTKKRKTHGFESLLAFNHSAYKSIGTNQIKRLESSLDGISYEETIRQLRASL